MALQNLGALTIFVDDIARTKAFYRDVFGLAVLFEDAQSVAFDFGNTILNCLQVDEAPGLIAPAKVADRTSGARMQLTIWVADTDAVCAEVQGNGVSLLNGPINRPWGVRTACVEDPDGHIWEFAQQLQANG
jgi:catechol 2,3-dioxygenase-like lactoylglutathione lyase family enzyme